MVDKNKICTLISGFLIAQVSGCYMIWGFISVYVYSYYKNILGTDISFDTINASYLVGNFFIAMTFPFAIDVAKKMKFRMAYLIIGSIMSSCFFFAALFESFWAFLIFYAALFNIGQGVLWISPAFVASKLYPNHKGMLSGLMLCGYGLGSSIAGMLFTVLINPDNSSPKKVNNILEFNDDISAGFPKAMKILSAYLLGLTFISFILFRVKGLENEHVNSQDRNQSLLSANAAEKKLSIEDENNLENIEETFIPSHEKNEFKFWRSKDFYLLIIMLAISNSFSNFLISNYKSYGLINIPDDQFISTLGSISLIVNAITRMMWGKLIDHWDFKLLFRISLLIQILLTTTMDYISGYKAIYLIYVSLGLTCQASSGTLFSMACMINYGVDKGAKVFGFVYYGFLASNIIQYLLTMFALSPLGYKYLFLIFAGLLVCDFLLTFFYKGKKHLIDPKSGRKIIEINTEKAKL